MRCGGREGFGFGEGVLLLLTVQAVRVGTGSHSWLEDSKAPTIGVFSLCLTDWFLLPHPSGMPGTSHCFLIRFVSLLNLIPLHGVRLLNLRSVRVLLNFAPSGKKVWLSVMEGKDGSSY